MELNRIETNALIAGLVLVCRTPPYVVRTQNQPMGTPQASRYALVIVTSVGSETVTLAPFAALWDDDSETEATESIPDFVRIGAVQECLARPVFEVGDWVRHRGRPARIQETKDRDMHVTICYEDSDGGTFYGNLIWMDLSPTLDLLARNAAWPTLT